MDAAVAPCLVGVSRNDEIVRAYKAGGTLREVGDQFGISHERVRQIVKAAGATVRPPRECPVCHGTFVPVKNADYCSKSCGMKAWQRSSRGVPVDREPDPPMWTRETIIQAIREFQDRYGRPPAAADWNVSQARAYGQQWRVDRFFRDGCWPHLSSVQSVFGSWIVALEAAGVHTAVSLSYPRVGTPGARAPSRATHYTEADYADGCPR